MVECVKGIILRKMREIPYFVGSIMIRDEKHDKSTASQKKYIRDMSIYWISDKTRTDAERNTADAERVNRYKDAIDIINSTDSKVLNLEIDPRSSYYIKLRNQNAEASKNPSPTNTKEPKNNTHKHNQAPKQSPATRPEKKQHNQGHTPNHKSKRPPSAKAHDQRPSRNRKT